MAHARRLIVVVCVKVKVRVNVNVPSFSGAKVAIILLMCKRAERWGNIEGTLEEQRGGITQKLHKGVCPFCAIFGFSLYPRAANLPWEIAILPELLCECVAILCAHVYAVWYCEFYEALAFCHFRRDVAVLIERIYSLQSPFLRSLARL